MKKYEYKVIEFPSTFSVTGILWSLNEMGQHGWELVNVDKQIAYFKRKVN